MKTPKEEPTAIKLWDELVAAGLAPGGHASSWSETPTGIRTQFARVVRLALRTKRAAPATDATPVPALGGFRRRSMWRRGPKMKKW
jgi:hypothetical protein